METKEAYIYFNYGAIGEAIMMVTLFEHIHQRKKSAIFTIISTRNLALVKDLVRRYDWIEVADVHDKRRFLGIFWRSLKTKSTVLLLPAFVSTKFKVALWAKLFSLRNVRKSPIGFIEPKWVSQYLFARRLPFELKKPIISNLASMLPALGLEPAVIKPHFEFDIDESCLNRYGLTKGGYAVFHLCAANTMRSLPEDRWSRIIKETALKLPRIDLVFTASRKDAEFVERVLNKSGVKGRILADLSLHEVASVINFAKFYVGVDTGITHVASVLGVRSIVIGNNSNPSWLPSYNPRGIILTANGNCTCDGRKSGNCLTEYQGKKYYRCMFEIPDERIVSEIIKV